MTTHVKSTLGNSGIERPFALATLDRKFVEQRLTSIHLFAFFVRI